MSKREHRDRSRSLRKRLLRAQRRLRAKQTPVVLLIAGVDGAGKGETVTLLNTWLDPRWICTRAFDDPTDEEIERPAFWRYWRALPAQGQTAVYLSAWYSAPLLQQVHCREGPTFSAQVDRIRRFEHMLAADGHVILKLWLHLSHEAQTERFRQLGSEPLQSWRVTEQDWQNCALYPRFAAAAEELLEATHAPHCPWVVIDGEDPRRCSLEVGEALLAAFQRGPNAAPNVSVEPSEAADAEVPAHPTTKLHVKPVDALEKPEYRDERAKLQGRLNQLHRHARASRISLIGVFEGRDAAGKGGAIRRLVPAFDARCVDIVRTGPPTDEERAHHYLWRFWRRLPRSGHVTLFDRSWYGRVFVERVEQLTDECDWRRAYAEINEFERQLVEHGIVLAKFWMEISFEEQERRFEERQRVVHKQWKLTQDDLRNRGFWTEYDSAIADALARTHTPSTPWTVVAADDKRHARLSVLRSLCEHLEQRLDGSPPQLSVAVGI